ncbi:MAG: hypothetical protein V2A67_07500 [Bacteroidota bacterium]
MHQPQNLIHPPRPPLAFRVGIVGHRPGRLESADITALQNLIGDILRTVKGALEEIGLTNKDIYADSKPVLRAISPLAEGADRIFAEQAIRQGYELSCPMPYFQEEFEKDFSPSSSQEPDSLEHFHEILDRAKKTTRLVRFELEGSRLNDGEAFRNNAQIVLNQSDLLLVIWDGHYHDKPGGTEETLLSARVQQIPILWIDACTPHSWQIIHPGQSMPEKTIKKRHIPQPGTGLPELRSLISGILAIPSGSGEKADDENQLRRLSEFYMEIQPRRNFALLWKFFRNLTGANRITFISPRIPPIDNSMTGAPLLDSSSTVSRLAEWLRPFYEWPDKLAENYSDRYRSGFILTFLLASLAVGLALFPLISGWLSDEQHSGLTICMILEALVILTILGLVFFTRKRRWHSRWLDYRMTAESVRQLKLFLPLGGGKPFPRMAAHLTNYGNPLASWMTWYVQAIERIAGLPSERVDTNHLRQCLAQYAELVEEQLNYHKQSASIYLKIEKRLHRTAELTLWLTLGACLIHLLQVFVPAIHFSAVFGNVLIFLCGFLPALGASMAGINHQGEFRRIAKSSTAMCDQFSTLAEETSSLLGNLSKDHPGESDTLFIRVTTLSRDIANLMINEVSDWKVVYQDRPPVLPA